MAASPPPGDQEAHSLDFGSVGSDYSTDFSGYSDPPDGADPPAKPQKKVVGDPAVRGRVLRLDAPGASGTIALSIGVRQTTRLKRGAVEFELTPGADCDHPFEFATVKKAWIVEFAVANPPARGTRKTREIEIDGADPLEIPLVGADGAECGKLLVVLSQILPTAQ
jgi:hypothetical protein